MLGFLCCSLDKAHWMLQWCIAALYCFSKWHSHRHPSHTLGQKSIHQIAKDNYTHTTCDSFLGQEVQGKWRDSTPHQVVGVQNQCGACRRIQQLRVRAVSEPTPRGEGTFHVSVTIFNYLQLHQMMGHFTAGFLSFIYYGLPNTDYDWHMKHLNIFIFCKMFSF